MIVAKQEPPIRRDPLMALLQNTHQIASVCRCLLMFFALLTIPSAFVWAEEVAESNAAPVGFLDQDFLTGDWGGLRTQWQDSGVSIGLRYTGEVVSNPRGGIHRGTDYEDDVQLGADVDLEKLVGWTGGSFRVAAMSVHGRGPSANNIGDKISVSNIEWLRNTRLSTLWVQQAAFDNLISLRVGQLLLDDEFQVSPTVGNFVMNPFSYMPVGFINLAGGGPVYPAGSPGARLQINATDEFSLLTGMFSHTPQPERGGGALFKINSGGAHVISELKYQVNQDKDAEGLPGVYMLGGWYDTGTFADQHFNARGQSLAFNADSIARQDRGNWALYAIADQTVWRSTDAESIAIFARVGFAPSDRNEVCLNYDFGASYTGLIPGRESDILSAGVTRAIVGSAARANNRDGQIATGVALPVRDGQTGFEVNYLVKLAPWWTLQPTAQYVLHPGFNIHNPKSVDQAAVIPDAAVILLRTVLLF